VFYGSRLGDSHILKI
jgi:hypothetical protein